MENQFVVKSFDVMPIMRRAYCPDCDVELERDSVVLATHPAQYQYFCPKCGYGYTSVIAYPTVDFAEITKSADATKEDAKDE